MVHQVPPPSLHRCQQPPAAVVPAGHGRSHGDHGPPGRPVLCGAAYLAGDGWGWGWGYIHMTTCIYF